MRRINLKTKIALVALFIFFSVVPLVALITLSHFKEKLRLAIEAHQTNLVTVVAEELDDKVRFAQGALVKAAESVPTDNIREPARARAFLRLQPALNYLFDNDLALVSPTGRMIAESAQTPSGIDQDLSYRDYVKTTLATGKPSISDPFVSSLPHHPLVIAFTAPVRGKDGAIRVILVGVIDLMRPNFLGRIANARFGRSGYFYIFNMNRTMIMHPDVTRIMKNDVPPGVDKRFDLAISKGDNTGETINSRGQRMLSSFKRLWYTNWILAVDYPVEEAYEPVREAALVALWIIVFGGLLSACVMWLIMRRLSAPILILTDQIRLIGPQGDYRKVTVKSGDEIEELADAFNGLMRRLKSEEERLSYLSSHDILTGLFNRAFYEVELERVKLGREFPVSVVMADLDNLKAVNDNLGHAAGDAMIRMAADILQDAFRAGDVVARIGGDEFAILVPGADEDAVSLALERIRSSVAARRQATKGYDFGISLGAATAMDGEHLLEALRLADQRMYQNKAKSGNEPK